MKTNTFAERVMARLKQIGMSQAQLARLCGWNHRKEVRRILDQGHIGSMDNLVLWCRHLDVPPEFFDDRLEERKRPEVENLILRDSRLIGLEQARKLLSAAIEIRESGFKGDWGEIGEPKAPDEGHKPNDHPR